MRIKSYFSRSIEEAMAAARVELGDDAVLVNSRRAPAESKHLGEYEVVFGMDGEQAPPPEKRDRLSAEVDALKKALDGMRREISRSTVGPAQWLAAPPGISEAYAALTQNEVEAELAREIVQSAHGTGEPLSQAVAREIESRLTVSSSLGRSGASTRIVSLIGPPGAGKTTTLLKLAVNYGLAARRPVLLISTDTYRVAAAEQLRAFAVILGAGFYVADTVAALAQTIEEHRGKELILIDTPGLSVNDMDSAIPLARFLSTRGDIDTHLVVSASMKPADLRNAVDAYEAFKPQRLLFTRLDETGTFGPMLSESVRTGKALSFFSTGQRVPEDLETASVSRVLELVLPQQTGAALRAA